MNTNLAFALSPEHTDAFERFVETLGHTAESFSKLPDSVQGKLADAYVAQLPKAFDPKPQVFTSDKGTLCINRIPGAMIVGLNDIAWLALLTTPGGKAALEEIRVNVSGRSKDIIAAYNDPTAVAARKARAAEYRKAAKA